MSESTGLLGVVLAGGESRRFGSPKALATWRGEALWARAARALGEVGVPVLVLANDPEVAGEVAAAGVGDVRPDLRRGRGPLAGIETGLVQAEARGDAGILVLACDLVRVEAEHLRAVTEGWPGTGAAAFTAPGPWGAEPLCSVWGTDLLDEVRAALDDGSGSPGELLGRVPHRRLDPPTGPGAVGPDRLFRSVNRPDDLTRHVTDEAAG